MINWDGVASDMISFDIGDVTRNVDLKKLSRWKIGGVGELCIEPSSTLAVSIIVKYCNTNKIPYLTVGDGSNLLFDDGGLNALVIKIGRSLSSLKIEKQQLTCGAGIWVPSLARNSASSGLSGLEHIVGIPGTLGGLICMNGGSQRKGIGDNIVQVEGVDSSGEVFIASKDQCGFDYRESVFQENGAIITGCIIELTDAPTSRLRKEMLDVLKSRREKFPLKLPNCGSVFVSNPSMYEKIGPPGHAIESVGLKGFSVGGASVSELHANFFVNTGGATSADMIALVFYVQHEVYKITGFTMSSEVRHVSSLGVVLPISDRAGI
jgi:UDP-N-acetylmuramate dehydrogenase